MRGVRHDRDPAIAMGIPANRAYVVTFALGFALAALGGVVAAPITTVEFRGGVDILPFCFMAVIIGGLGEIPGTPAPPGLLALLGGVVPTVAPPTGARSALPGRVGGVARLRRARLVHGRARRGR